jgi:hypothetical protein
MSRKFCNWLAEGREAPVLGRVPAPGRVPALGRDTLGGLALGREVLGRDTLGVEGRLKEGDGRLTEGVRLTEGREKLAPPPLKPPPPPTRPPPPPPRPPRASTSPAAKRHIADITTSSKENRFMIPPRIWFAELLLFLPYP